MADSKAKKPQRNARFEIAKQLFSMWKGGYVKIEDVKKQFLDSNLVIFRSELEKFMEVNPNIDAVQFESFLKDSGAYKVAGKKGTGESKTTSLSSDEKIAILGILPEDVQAYKDALTVMQTNRKIINGLIKNENYSCGMYITKHGKDADPEPAQPVSDGQ